MEKIFFESWESIFRTLILTILAYFTMVIMLRVSGKRTLSKMNAFDFIVTIALGSALGTVALNKQVTLTDGALVFFLLIFMQYAITWLAVRSKSVRTLFTSQPALLLYKGELIEKAIRKERISLDEINVAARKQGIDNLKDIDIIVLEPTGDLSIIQKLTTGQATTLKDVKHFS